MSRSLSSASPVSGARVHLTAVQVAHHLRSVLVRSGAVSRDGIAIRHLVSATRAPRMGGATRSYAMLCCRGARSAGEVIPAEGVPALPSYWSTQAGKSASPRRPLAGQGLDRDRDLDSAVRPASAWPTAEHPNA